jgi:hypothetical protein
LQGKPIPERLLGAGTCLPSRVLGRECTVVEPVLDEPPVSGTTHSHVKRQHRSRLSQKTMMFSATDRTDTNRQNLFPVHACPFWSVAANSLSDPRSSAKSAVNQKTLTADCADARG